MVGARLRRRPADRALGRLGRRADGRGRPTWCARTAGTTPAARCAAVRWPARCRRRGRPTSGSAATSAVTGSPRTSSCCRTASTTGRCPGTARELVAAHERGQVALPWLRGRAGVPPPGQAAQHHARGELGLLGHRRPAGASRSQPTDAAGGRGRAVDGDDGRSRRRGRRGGREPAVRRGADRLTCRATHPAHSRTWHVSPGLDRAPRPAGGQQRDRELGRGERAVVGRSAGSARARARWRRTPRCPRARATTSPMRAARASSTGPKTPLATASSRLATQARSPSTARHRASTSSAAPGSACT